MYRLLNDTYIDIIDDIIIKWTPIINNLYENSSKLKKELMCLYSEYDKRNSSLKDDKYLDTSLYIIDQLDIDDKNIQMVSLPKFVIKNELGMIKENHISINSISRKRYNENLVDLIDDLIGDLIFVINTDLKKYDSMFIYSIIEDINITEDEVSISYIFCFEDDIEDIEKTDDIYYIDDNFIISKLNKFDYIKTIDNSDVVYWINKNSNRVVDIYERYKLLDMYKEFENKIQKLKSNMDEIKSKLKL